MKTIILGLGLLLCMITFTGCEKEDYTDTTDNSQYYNGYSVPSNDKDEEPIDTIQNMLDSGRTPLEIYNEGIPVEDIYGKTYQGGLIAYLNTSDGTGLICAPYLSGRSYGYLWDVRSDFANLIIDGYKDWYLPSKNDLTMIYYNLHKKGLGGFGDVYYLYGRRGSSFSYVKSFKDGSIKDGTGGKWLSRAVRKF